MKMRFVRIPLANSKTSYFSIALCIHRHITCRHGRKICVYMSVSNSDSDFFLERKGGGVGQRKGERGRERIPNRIHAQHGAQHRA